MEPGRWKPIVFIDFHGTICHDHYWRSLPEDRQAHLGALLYATFTALGGTAMQAGTTHSVDDILDALLA